MPERLDQLVENKLRGFYRICEAVIVEDPKSGECRCHKGGCALHDAISFIMGRMSAACDKYRDNDDPAQRLFRNPLNIAEPHIIVSNGNCALEDGRTGQCGSSVALSDALILSFTGWFQLLPSNYQEEILEYFDKP